MGSFAVFFVVFILLVLALAGLGFALAAARAARRPRPALPANCGDCGYMIPRAKVYKRETIEDLDGVVHYLCQQRWIARTPYSPRCESVNSKSRTSTARTRRY